MTKWLALLAILVSADAQAWNCKHERSLDEVLDVDGSESLAIEALAGDLEVTGVSHSDEVRIRGRICASKKDWLDEMRIETSGGDRARIGVDMPNMESGWSLFGGNRYAYVDLVLEVPEDLALEIRDTSGDITLENTTVASVVDSSGDIEISDARGALELRDTSGDVTLRGLAGDLTVLADSSGDLHGRDIDGAVTVLRDSSGDIRFTDVSKDVTVERDSSGDIVVASIGGDFSVLRDGSGDIRSTDVKGEVSVPGRR